MRPPVFRFRLLVTVPTRTDNDVALYNSITNDEDGGGIGAWEDDYPDYYEDVDPIGDGDDSRWDSFSDIKEYSDDSKFPVCQTFFPLLI